MEKIRIAILGCGTVGGGVAKILLEIKDILKERSEKEIELAKIVDLFPQSASKKNNIPINLFCGGGKDLSKEEADNCIEEILSDKTIDVVVETIGGSSEYILNLVMKILNSKKHFITANKALLAKYGKEIFETAEKNNVSVGFEASVCGAIPIIKAIKECFTGDMIESISGIMNGTSNYILSKMKFEGKSFAEALKMAQNLGYAEADPTLDINGGDAGNKLAILLKLAFGLNVSVTQIPITGIEKIEEEDMDFANEMNCTIKLICYAKKEGKKIFATVRPMMIKNDNFLSNINGATNAVKLLNKYSGEHILVGKGAGSTETGSAIVSDIIFIAKYKNNISNKNATSDVCLTDEDETEFPYNISFETKDVPGITGAVTTAIGDNNINIDTVGHNRHNKSKAIFSVATMPCKLSQIKKAVAQIKTSRPDILKSEPKIIPILY